jgi:outer membrane protein assembly factor BamB
MKLLRLPLVLLIVISPALAVAADWPQFRGPGGLGIAAKEQGLPLKWDDETNIAWKVALPGPGSSSPIVVGERVLLTCYSGYGVAKKEGDLADLRRHLLCYDRAGKPLWKKDVTAQAKDYPYSSFLTNHGYASSTPASDGRNVFVFFGVAGVLAYDLDGKELWRSSVGTAVSDWGSGSSPLLYKDLVIVNASVESSALVALYKDTGKKAWTVKGVDRSWSTPTLVDAGDHQELVLNQHGKFRAYNPDTGKALWSCAGTADFYVAGETIAHDGVVYAIGGRDYNLVAVKAGGKGEVKELWRIKRGSNVSSPVYHKGHLYWAHEGNGIVYCAKAADGTLVYEKRLDPNPGRIYASATYGDGKIYYVSRQGGTFVIDASPTFALLAHNQFRSDTSVFNASPAIADGQLFLRSDRNLYCIGKKK